MDDERIARLETKVELWMESTTSYRRDLCSKLDRVMNKLEELPCRERIEGTKSIRTEIGWLQKIIWTVCCIGLPSIIGLAVTWGTINHTVSLLTATSYGYRGIKVVKDEDFVRMAQLPQRADALSRRPEAIPS